MKIMNYELRSTYVAIGALLSLLLMRTCDGERKHTDAPLTVNNYHAPLTARDTVVVYRYRDRYRTPAMVTLRDTVRVADTVIVWRSPLTDTVFVATVPDTVPPPDTQALRATPLPDTDTLPSRFSIGLYAGTGVQQLVADLRGCSMEHRGLAPTFGAEFAWYFAPHWGVSLGADMSFYSVRLMAAGITPQNTDRVLTQHDEVLRATYVGVPLLMQFRTPAWGSHTLHAAAGARFDLAVHGSYSVTGRHRLVAAGSTDEPFAYSGKASFQPGVSLLAETGIRWALDKQWGIYTGAYVGYGLSDVMPTASSAAAQASGASSLLDLRNRQGATYVERIRLQQVLGVKVKLTMDW